MLIFIGLVAAIIVLAFSRTSIGTLNLNQNPDTITVSSQGKVSFDPDEAYFYVSIITLDNNAALSQKQNSDISDAVRSALLSEGLKSDEIETSAFALYPKYEWDSVSREQTLKGYEVMHTFKITTSKIDKIGNYLDAAVNAGANQVNSVTFGLTKEKQDKAQLLALEEAVENAESKAETIAKAMNLRLSGISQVIESTYYYTPVSYETKTLAYVEDAGTSISPKDISVTASITAVYKID